MSHGRALKVAPPSAVAHSSAVFYDGGESDQVPITFFCTNLHQSPPPFQFMHLIVLHIEPVLSIHQLRATNGVGFFFFYFNIVKLRLAKTPK